MTDPEAHVIATTAIFVFKGLDEERQSSPSFDWFDTGEGFMGIASVCAEVAKTVCVWYDEMTEEQRNTFTGVFDYDIVEPLGAALFHNIAMTNDEIRSFLTAALVTNRLTT